MIFENVIFPQQLVDALEENRLVIFSGAGVSMGAPAFLPNFWSLAKHLAGGTGRDPEEPLDRFIGTLPFSHQALRNRTAAKIATASSHTLLHENLMRVFVEKTSVKVVTTNFDILFESASKNLWGDIPNIFTAPALPLGSKFDGIVHIHGSINSTDSIVLTDSDFGRAYLTEGWARRFLVDLFEHYTVLFVGYSHEDTVLQYLARALPDKAQGKRFSLVGAKGNPAVWNVLGIEPIIYPQENQNDFSLLDNSVRQLADFANRRPSDWQALISDIANNPPSMIDISDEATIRYALKDIAKLRFFCKSATSFEWLDWLDSEQALEDLFHKDRLDERIEMLGRWIAENIVEHQPDRAIQLIAKHGFRLGSEFWLLLCHKATEEKSSVVFKKWLDVLLQAKPS